MPPRRTALAGPLLQLEALLVLLVAVLVVRLRPFAAIAAQLTTPPRSRQAQGRQRRLQRARVKAAIFRIWRRYPPATRCIHRALAAHWMLRRRGVATTICYGARTLPGRGLCGHVWLMDGRVGVVGHHVARDYPVLATWPPLPPVEGRGRPLPMFSSRKPES